MVFISLMTESESSALIEQCAQKLGIEKILTDEYRQEIYNESAGHSYVIKILLGEVAEKGRLVDVRRIVASSEDILIALFERTYVSLAPAAQRIFLTLCNWNSAVPQIALEAVLLRPENKERMDVKSAIEELSRSSMIEVVKSEKDGQFFLNVPLVPLMFGKQKLAASRLKTSVQADSSLLQLLGASKRTSIHDGIEPRIQRLFKAVAKRLETGELIETYLPILESISRNYHEGWLLIAKLYIEKATLDAYENAKTYLQRYLEVEMSSDLAPHTWKKLSDLCE